MQIFKFFIVIIVSLVAGGSIVFLGFVIDEGDILSSGYTTVPPLQKQVIDETNKEVILKEFQERLFADIVIEKNKSNEDVLQDDLVKIVETEGDSMTEIAVIGEKITSDDTHLLQVPFTSQAPSGNWDLPWQETCEEAALVMMLKYFKNEPLTQSIAIDEITNIVEYQANQGLSYYDTNMSDTSRIANELYGLNSYTIDNPTNEDIKERIKKGHPVFVPTAGRLLRNPFFTPPGPFYHVVVVIGFDELTLEFIVHDPGTRFGSHFRYGYESIQNAMHDWTGSAETILTGEKRVLVLTGFNDDSTTL